jgi:hypothetical protein
MKIRSVLVGMLSLVLVLAMSAPVLAGSPHFVGKDPKVTRVGDTLVVSGKVAGLGNEDQIFVEVTALAECVNPGNNKPNADNKDEVSAGDNFPVQNGKANFTVDLDGGEQISPDCSPPMTIEYSDVLVQVFFTDADGNPVGDPILEAFFPGPF